MSPEPPEIFHVIDPRQFSRVQLDELCQLTDAVRYLAKTRHGALFLQNLLPHKRAMLYFTQPSTRTFLSFNNACHILGIRTSEIRDPSISSEIKGESQEDSLRTFSAYADVIVMRTWEEGLANRTATMMDAFPRRVPVINAGSGKDLHPTQALLDVYTLQNSFSYRGGFAHKVVGLMGDLKRGRTVRSLCYLMRLYAGVRLVLISPPEYALGEDVKAYLREHQVEFEEVTDLHSVLPQLDAIYVTRLQSEHDKREGTAAVFEYARYSLGTDEMTRLKADAIVMHPLPRGPELSMSVDNDPRATYWRQERNGMWMRVALLLKIFKVETAVMEAMGPVSPIPRH